MSRILIIGGMGPQASLELHKRLLQAAIAHGAVNNNDFPEIVHLSIPVPDFIDGRDSGPALRMLEKTLREMTFRPDDTAVIACNTVHLLMPHLKSICQIRFVSLIEASLQAAQAASISKVGVLASPATIKSGLYSTGKYELEVMVPSEQEFTILERAIRGVIAGEQSRQFKVNLKTVIDNLRHRGAQKIILGCTELSVIYSGLKDVHVIDPLDEVLKDLIKV